MENESEKELSILDPDRWGLPADLLKELPERLRAYWGRYRGQFWTQTRDQSLYAQHYLVGMMRAKKTRTFQEIGHETGQAGENIQHFMSNSPWSAAGVIEQVQREIRAHPAWQQGSALILDESADVKAGAVSAGSGRQHNGRLGKIDMSQVGVFVALVNGPLWTWIDGALFLPQAWFQEPAAARRHKAGIPTELTFKTKVELGWDLIQRAQQRHVPFEWVACDDLYGRADWFRAKLQQANILYMADVPCTTQVYRTEPQWGIPAPQSRHAPTPRVPQVLSPEPAVEVQTLSALPEMQWQRLQVRKAERGMVEADYAAWRVWTLRDERPSPEWLLVRRDADGKIQYSLSNAPETVPLMQLARMEASRALVEAAIRDAKSELGWDEFQAQKYLAWQHQLALTILASWFIAEARWDWQHRFPPDPQLLEQLEVESLPNLSVANVRDMLRAAMPRPELTEDEARALVAQHLLNRTRSRKSRLKKQMSKSEGHTRDPS